VEAIYCVVLAVLLILFMNFWKMPTQKMISYSAKTIQLFDYSILVRMIPFDSLNERASLET